MSRYVDESSRRGSMGLFLSLVKSGQLSNKSFVSGQLDSVLQLGTRMAFACKSYRYNPTVSRTFSVGEACLLEVHSDTQQTRAVPIKPFQFSAGSGDGLATVDSSGLLRRYQVQDGRVSVLKDREVDVEGLVGLTFANERLGALVKKGDSLVRRSIGWYEQKPQDTRLDGIVLESSLRRAFLLTLGFESLLLLDYSQVLVVYRHVRGTEWERVQDLERTERDHLSFLDGIVPGSSGLGVMLPLAVQTSGEEMSFSTFSWNPIRKELIENPLEN